MESHDQSGLIAIAQIAGRQKNLMTNRKVKRGGL
jgi:hypothetical protein